MHSELSYKIDNSNPDEKKRKIRSMFDSIVPTYDFLNRILSMGIDHSWRKALIKLMQNRSKLPVLDLCCGTGDLSRMISKTEAELISLDFSMEMLKKGILKGWLPSNTISADASRLPFKDSAFSHLTIAFGIRNIPDIDNFLKECHRVLAQGGSLLILELTRPSGRFFSVIYNFYLLKALPFLGGIISGRKEAYKYLAETISTFINSEELSERAREKGFSEVQIHRKTFGIATIFQCFK